MKILLFSDFAPTEENYNGPSAFCYHLLKELQDDNDVKIITTNANKVPEHILFKSIEAFKGNYIIRPRNLLMKFLVSRKTGKFFSPFYKKKLPYISRYKLDKKILRRIRLFAPDIVLIYPNHLLLVCKQLSEYPVISLGPDCATLNSLRILKDTYIYDSGTDRYKKVLVQLKKYISLEKELSKVITKTCLVGIEDTIIFNTVTHTDKSVFLPHPHYRISEKNICFCCNELKVLISGAFNVSTYTDVKTMLDTFVENTNELKNFSFTFLGKGWNEIISKLPSSVKARTITWVDNYIEEIKKYDIQIFPISFGAGTKGKVLDALAMGLLCIGSYYAFENIAVRSGEHCIIYDDAKQIVAILEDVSHNKEKYRAMAERGKVAVRKYHSPKLCSEYLLNVIKGECLNVSETYYTEKKV